MPRVTVYVSDELKERMDRIEDRANWSSAAQRAFEQAIAGEEWKMQTDVKERAIARLRQSKKKFEESERRSGKEAGRKWALELANYEELEALSRDAAAAVENNLPSLTAEEFVASVEREDHVTHRDVEQWWNGTIPSEEHVEGFIEGTLEVFDELKSQL